MTISARQDDRVTKLESLLLGFTVDQAITTPLCIETIVTDSQAEYSTFKVDGQTKELAKVLATSIVTVVLEAAGDTIRALNAWTCLQGRPSIVLSQSFKVVAAPSVIISISLVGLKSIEEVTKNVEATIIKSFAKVLGVPQQAVSIHAGTSRAQRSIYGPAPTADSGIGLITTSFQEPTSPGLVDRGKEIIKRRNTGVIVRVRILTTSQTHAELLAQKAATTAYMAELIATLAEYGINVDLSSITASVVQPLNVSNITSSQIDGQIITANSNPAENNVAIIAGSVSGGVCLLSAFFFFVFLKIRNKQRTASQLSKEQSFAAESTQESQSAADLPQGQAQQGMPNQTELLSISAPIPVEPGPEGDGCERGNSNQPSPMAGAKKDPISSNITVYDPISAGHENVEIRLVILSEESTSVYTWHTLFEYVIHRRI